MRKRVVQTRFLTPVVLTHVEPQGHTFFSLATGYFFRQGEGGWYFLGEEARRLSVFASALGRRASPHQCLQ
jgi:hypothetical protein